MEKVKSKVVVCLPGPCPLDYFDVFSSRVSKIIGYENNKEILLIQNSQFNHIDRDVTFNLGDILDSPVRKTWFYDFDFCRTILSVDKSKFEKFRDCNFSSTFCTRYVGINNTILILLRIMKEKPVSITRYSDGTIDVISDKNSYHCVSYKENTKSASMIHILKNFKN